MRHDPVAGGAATGGGSSSATGSSSGSLSIVGAAAAASADGSRGGGRGGRRSTADGTDERPPARLIALIAATSPIATRSTTIPAGAIHVLPEDFAAGTGAAGGAGTGFGTRVTGRACFADAGGCLRREE